MAGLITLGAPLKNIGDAIYKNYFVKKDKKHQKKYEKSHKHAGPTTDEEAIPLFYQVVWFASSKGRGGTLVQEMKTPLHA